MPQSIARQLLGFGTLPVQRQLGVLVGIGLVIALAVTIVMWGVQPAFTTVLPGMSERDKAEAIEILTRAGIANRLDAANGALLVPESKIHEARLQLATGGLPREQGVGFELLERDAGFGTSRLVEDTRFQRALEGELARSVMTLNNVESARVHLALPRQTAFVRERARPSASVLVDLRPGRSIDDVQVAAIVHLVASSVPELEPDRVTVVDQRGRLLSRPDDVEGGAPGPQLDYTRRVEESVRKRVQDILAPLVGESGMRVQVSAEIDFTRIESTRESYDGDKRVLRSEQVSEDENRSGVAAGVPGALSNQPPGAATVVAQTRTGGAGQSGAAAPATNREDVAADAAALATAPPQSRSTQATRNYEVDRTIEHTRQAPGTLRRLSVAVVVDHRETVGAEGKPVRTPRDAAELEHLTALVRQAVGYDEARGDRVNLVNASFVEAADPPAAAEPVPIWKEAWLQDLVKQVLAGVGVLLLILFVLRPALTRLAAYPAGSPIYAGPPSGGAGPLANDSLSLGSGRTGPSPEQRLLQARSVAKEDPRLVAHVVKQWMDKDE
jgi:flagellar M-ring protein FliF